MVVKYLGRISQSKMIITMSAQAITRIKEYMTILCSNTILSILSWYKWILGYIHYMTELFLMIIYRLVSALPENLFAAAAAVAAVFLDGDCLVFLRDC